MPKLNKPLPPIELLRDRYNYNPDTGEFKNRKTGTPIVRATKIGQYGIFINYRVAYAMYYGTDPGAMQIDHIDGDKSNNRISNLRLATHEQNLYNQKVNSTNTSGYKGVVQYYSRWRAYICINYKRINLGTFDTPEEAHKAYCEAADKHHGKFANHG